MLREALHILISAVLYRPATPDETRQELARWERAMYPVTVPTH